MHPVLVGLWPGVHQRDLEPQWDEWEEARCISTVADVAVLPSQKQQRTTTLHTSIGIFQILSQEVEKLTSGLWLELSWNHLKNPNQTKMRFFFTCLDCMASLVPTKIPSRSPGLEEITWPLEGHHGLRSLTGSCCFRRSQAFGLAWLHLMESVPSRFRERCCKLKVILDYRTICLALHAYYPIIPIQQVWKKRPSNHFRSCGLVWPLGLAQLRQDRGFEMQPGLKSTLLWRRCAPWDWR